MYFIQPIEGGRIKIGWSRVLGDRLSGLQRMSAVELRLVGLQLGTHEEEHRWHLHFHQYRDYGEWFSLPNEVLDRIPKLDVPISLALFLDEANKEYIEFVLTKHLNKGFGHQNPQHPIGCSPISGTQV